ncbi:protein rep, partial [Staphylococcus aureus]
MLTKLFTVKTIFAFIVLYRCAYNFNFATEPNDGSYNQHMHVLLCVENAYFRKKENYITQEEWV